MASVSVPAPPRNVDNVRSGDRGAPTRAVNRGRGGARGGPSRRRGGGGAGGGGARNGSTPGPAASTTPAPKPELKVTTTPAPVQAATNNNKTTTTPSVVKPSPASTRPGRRNGNVPGPKTPAVNVTPASPNVDKAATTPKRARNDRRPRTKAPAPSKSVNGDATTPKSVNGKAPAASEPAPPVIQVSKEAPPHVASATPDRAPVIEVTKDAPPHLATPAPDKPNMTIKTSGIDSLVDHVRHMAMERPITPGSASHIDWAGDDEDDTLPDLDDWGVPSASTTSTGGLDKLMSPILDDSIKQLPIHVKTPLLTASGLSPSIGSLKDEFKAEKSPAQSAADAASSLNTSPSAPSSLGAAARGQHTSIMTDISTSHSDSSIPTAPRTAPPFNATHGRSRTLGRPPNTGMGAGIPHRPFQSGSATPRDGIHPRHARTQSTPPSAGGPARHNRQGSRPVIAGTALAQIARSLGGGGSALKREAATAATAAPP